MLPLTASRTTTHGSLNSGANQTYNIGRGFSTNTGYLSGFLDDFRIYSGLVLTQTQVNQLYNRIIDKSYPILKEERRYPPKLYDSSTDEAENSGELTGINPTTYYKETITLSTTGISYGSGTYNIYSSSLQVLMFLILLFKCLCFYYWKKIII